MTSTFVTLLISVDVVFDVLDIVFCSRSSSSSSSSWELSKLSWSSPNWYKISSYKGMRSPPSSSPSSSKLSSLLLLSFALPTNAFARASSSLFFFFFLIKVPLLLNLLLLFSRSFLSASKTRREEEEAATKFPPSRRPPLLVKVLSLLLLPRRETNKTELEKLLLALLVVCIHNTFKENAPSFSSSSLLPYFPFRVNMWPLWGDDEARTQNTKIVFEKSRSFAFTCLRALFTRRRPQTQKRSPRAALFYINGWVRVRREEDDDAQRELFIFFLTGVGRPTKTENVNFSQLKTIFFARVFQLGEQRERESRERGEKIEKSALYSHQQFTHSHAHYDILFTWLGPPLFVVTNQTQTRARI